MLKKLYPILVEVKSKEEKEYIKYCKLHGITCTKGKKHIMMGPDGKKYVVRHLSIEMTDEEDKIFSSIFELHTIV